MALLLALGAYSGWPKVDGPVYRLTAAAAARQPPAAAAAAPPRRARLADGCEHVYLDVGTNIGVQIRKLFEPAHYPRAAVLPVYDAAFGLDRRRRVCAFGWEANPAKTARLREIEAAYRRRGWRTTIHTETAAGVREGTIPFFWSGDPWRDLAASAIVSPHLSAAAKASPLRETAVRTMDLARFINEEVHARRRPAGAPTAGRVVMKLDVEGAELDLLPDLLIRGALCAVDTLYLEMHPTHFARARAAAQRYAALARFVATTLEVRLRAGPNATKPLDTDCALALVQLDDESYLHDDGFSGAKADRWMRRNASAARAAGVALVRPALP